MSDRPKWSDMLGGSADVARMMSPDYKPPNSNNNPGGMRGWLLKKAGGKALDKKTRLLDRWHKRFFILPPGGSTLFYYKGENDRLEAKDPLGTLECAGATIFLKEVKNGQYRFTIQAKSRELKLRAATAGDYDEWMSALSPFASSVRQEDDVPDISDLSVRESVSARGEDFDEDSEEEEAAAASARPSAVRPSSSARSPSCGGLTAQQLMLSRAGAGAPEAPPGSLGGGRVATNSVACSSVTSGSMRTVAMSSMGMRGLLEKKSGGAEGKKSAKWKLVTGENWRKRW
jgi:hypothetical protein